MELNHPLLSQAIALSTLLSLSMPVVAFADNPPGANANDKQDEQRWKATEHFTRALDLYGERDYAGALVEFRQSYETLPHYKILYNIGQSCFQLQDYPCALESLETYLADGRANVSPERRDEVTKDIEKLRARVGYLSITTSTVGAEVLVDDVSVGTAPLVKPVLVGVGRRRVQVTVSQHAAATRIVEVRGGETANVDVEVPMDVVPSVATTSPSRMTTLSWIGFGTAAALAGTAVATGVLAGSTAAQLEETTFVGKEPSAEAEALSSRANAYAVTTDVLIVAAAATALTTVYFTFLRSTPTKEPAAPKVSASVGPLGAFVRGEF